MLQSVTHAGVQNPSQMTWDGAGNRITFSSSTGGDYTFVYDPTAGIPAVIEEYRQGSGLEPMVYIREPNGNLVARYDPNEFTTHWYCFDALGSTRMLTDGSGNVTDRYTYDAWGKLVDHDTYTGSVAQPYQYVGQLGYYTHVQDPNMDLLQLGVRFYDPETGRFTQVDPLPREMGAYAYAGDGPTRWIDPDGMERRDRAECDEEYRRCSNCATIHQARCAMKCSWSMGILGGATVGTSVVGGACAVSAEVLALPVVIGAIVTIGLADYVGYRICMRECEREHSELVDACAMAHAMCLCQADGVPLRSCRYFAPWR